MTTQSQLIEDVVQNVLRELREGTNAAPALQSPPSPASSSRRVITDSVVTEATLAAITPTDGEVVFGAKTVLTPSARDYLRQRKIAWTRSAGSSISRTDGITVGPKIIVTHSTIAVGSAFNRGDLVRVSPEKAVQAATDAAADGIVLVLTDRPHVLSIELNRNQSLRAIVIDDFAVAAADIRDSSANCVCAKPNGRTADELRRLARVISNCEVRG